MPTCILSIALAGATVMPARAQSQDAFVVEASQRFALPQSLIKAVMRIESADNPAAVSPVGAMGLMQIMPATWSMLTARHGLGARPFEPRANILAGAAYLREMLDRYGELPLALAAYNAGPGRVDAYRTTGRPLPSETRTYVARVTGAADLAVGKAHAGPVPDWRDGGLFAERSAATDGGTGTIMTSRPLGITAPGERTDSTAALPVSGALFVPVASRGIP